MRQVDRRKFLSVSALLGSAVAASPALAQQNGAAPAVDRVASRDKAQPPNTAPHPLDPALDVARSCLKHVQKNIVDYTAILIKREYVNGGVGDYQYMGVKIRNRREKNGKIDVPFSVYMTFLKPTAIKGREVIYVENQNNGNLVAHEGGMKGRFLPTVELDPNGMMAMRGQRYPITDLGVENLVVKLIEKGERDRQKPECDVQFRQGATVGGRECTLLSVEHPVEREYFDFYRAEIFIDNEMKIPVRYCAYSWPTTPGGKPQLLEEYTYQKVRLNVGLTDKDFDRNNSKYRF